MNVTIKLRRGLASQWSLKNTILQAGEPGFEEDTGKFKIGDGMSGWNFLPYYMDAAGVSILVTELVQGLVFDGVPGPEGPQGIQGVKGDKGDPGQDGAPGLPGRDGVDGAPGTPGADGTDGADGAPGLKGDQGIQGIQGVKGDKGDPGTPGSQGIQGVKGDPGTPGSQGIQGVKGDKGDTGPVGPITAKNLTSNLDPTADQFGSWTIVADGSDSGSWKNRLEFLFKPVGGTAALTGYFNEYGELRVIPGKANTVPFRAFTKQFPTDANHTANVLEVQDNRTDRNVLFSVDSTGKVAAPNIGAKVWTLNAGDSNPAGLATGDVVVKKRT